MKTCSNFPRLKQIYDKTIGLIFTDICKCIKIFKTILLNVLLLREVARKICFIKLKNNSGH